MKSWQPLSGKIENVTRLEVIDENGRTYTRWNCTLEILVQDSGRTLKIFAATAPGVRPDKD